MGAYEDKVKELRSIVQKLETGELSLEESAALYERGNALIKECEILLNEFEARIGKIA